MAEAMHKKCFQNSFGIMETPVVQGICLHRVDHTFTFVTKILVDREIIEDWIEKQRSQILAEEKCPVRNLWAQILEYNS